MCAYTQIPPSGIVISTLTKWLCFTNFFQ